ncbi:MAG: ATP-binding protein [Kofleriaceae bacterium]
MSLRKGNASLPVAALVGRGSDLAALLDRIADGHRLVTLTGPGGIGKTRLLREVLGRASEGYAMHGGGGAWFVDLSRVQTPDEASSQVASILGVRGDLARGLGRKQRLLLGLDNLEQLRGFASVIAQWLAAAPALQVITTSRTALGIEGEHAWPLSPLPLADAAALFVARYRAIDPHVAFDPAQVDAIVARVDRVPLAIELAAARVKVLTPAQILEKLDAPLALLARDHDDGRHGSIRRTIEDSIALLPAHARSSVAALGVFAGGFELDAFASVAGDDADSALEALCDHGLVARILEDGAWTGHFAMFESVAHLAREIAERDNVLEPLRAKLRSWYTRWAKDIRTSDPARARREIAIHLDNAVAVARDSRDVILAIDPHLATLGQHRRRLELLAGGDPEIELARGAALRELGDLAGAASAWRTLDRDDVAPRVRALAVARYAELVEVDGRTDEAQALLERALTIANDEAEVYARLAHARRREGELDGARHAASHALTLFARRHDLEGVAAMHYELAVIAMFLGDSDAVERGLAETIALATTLGAQLHVAAANAALGIHVQARGDLSRAIGLLAEAARTFRDAGHVHREGSTLFYLAGAYLERGEIIQALIVCDQATACIDAVGAARYQALLGALAAVAHALHGDAVAARTALARAESAEARCRREKSLRAVLAIARLRVESTTCATEARAIADGVAGDDPQLFARLVAGSDAQRPRMQLTRSGDVVLDGALLELGKRPALRKIVAVLAEHRIAAPGEAVPLDALVAAGWPGEKIRADAASNRIHVALSTLRRLGLRDVLITVEGGYAFDPAIGVTIDA